MTCLLMVGLVVVGAFMGASLWRHKPAVMQSRDSETNRWKTLDE